VYFKVFSFKKVGQGGTDFVVAIVAKKFSLGAGSSDVGQGFNYIFLIAG